MGNLEIWTMRQGCWLTYGTTYRIDETPCGPFNKQWLAKPALATGMGKYLRLRYTVGCNHRHLT